MSELVSRIYRHTHDPAAGEAPIQWTCIEGRPEAGVIEREYVYECSSSNLVKIGQTQTTRRYIVLPGVARYNKGYGQTSLSVNGMQLTNNIAWAEVARFKNARRDETTAYWTHLVVVFSPVSNGVYRLTWKDKTVTDYVRGIREARVSDDDSILWDGHITLPVQYGGVEQYPNGVAWDPLPSGYKIEIWRKTRHKQSGLPNDTVLARNAGVRWMLWRTVDAATLAVNLDKLRRYPTGNPRKNTSTEAFRFAYLRPDGARSQLSIEVAVLHGSKPWGPNDQIHAGRVRVK